MTAPTASSSARAGWFHLRSAATLVLLALLLALGWRAEVEWHGWEGLTWVGAPHRAVSVGIVAFVAWTLTTEMAPTGRTRKVNLLVSGVAWGTVSSWLLDGHLRFLLGKWLFPAPQDVLLAATLTLVATLVAAPVGAFLIGRGTGAPLRLWTLPLSMALFFASVPLGIWVLPFVEPDHTGIEHAVKTGAAVPFAVLGVGIPWLTRRPPGTSD